MKFFGPHRPRGLYLDGTPCNHMMWDQTIIKHVLPAPLLETSTFSGVSLNSLKTLLVLSHRRILRPSLQLAWRISGSPNLIIASRNVLRQSSRPHRCALQRFTSNRVWAAVLATTTSLRIVLQVLMQGRPDQVRSTLSFGSSFMILEVFITFRNVSS